MQPSPKEMAIRCHYYMRATLTITPSLANFGKRGFSFTYEGVSVMDVRDTTYDDINSNVAVFDSAVSGIGLSMLVAMGFALINLLF